MGQDLDPSAPVPLHEVIRIPAYGEAGRDELKQRCFDLRIAVFVHEQGFPLDVEIDQLRRFLSIPCTSPYPGRLLPLAWAETILLKVVTLPPTPSCVPNLLHVIPTSFPANIVIVIASISLFRRWHPTAIPSRPFVQRRRPGDALPRPAPPLAQTRRHHPRGNRQIPDSTNEDVRDIATDARARENVDRRYRLYPRART